ncbi:cupin-like domain-containing protein [Paraburkholderia sp. J94]|uniref:cupin-like domain-containing protein n=1 Tax=Paraburkholderia sp. J94 TaxID=2805441 RepID=UPI002AAF573D|nr:cupin-like domain-containing protein [Paraburkholderia sp. J94]
MSTPGDAVTWAFEPQFPADNNVLQACKPEFKNNFNCKPFKFNHTLHRCGLFEIPRIAEVAERMMKRNGDFCAINLKQGSVGSKFSDMPNEGRLKDAFDEVGESATWIKLTQAQYYDPEYERVLDQVTEELEDLSGFPLRKDMTWRTMTLIVASPKIATPFHIDHETNFLFQIQGSKDVCLFPASDRELVPDQEIERYYSGNFEAAHYRQELQDRGTIFRLAPGEVVHHPSLAPHWVRNDNNVSVSISISYCMKSLERCARVYQANYILRKFGLKPLSPGLSPMRDKLKRMLMSTLEHRNPKTFAEVVHEPLNRFRSPLNAARRIVKR